MEPIRPTRVLVCGVNYGRAYLDAIQMDPRHYVLTGILTHGSARSIGIAAHQGVPLYRTVGEMPHPPEIACVATGGNALPLVESLLERGVAVLCEHPQPELLIRRALEYPACFHINGHFADLSAPQAFLARSATREKPAFLHLMTTDRSLYAALDIVRRALGAADPFDCGLLGKSAVFTSLTGQIAGIPFIVSIQDSRSLIKDGSPEYLLDMRLTFLHRTGSLILESVAGPVIWSANLNSSDAGDELYRITPGESLDMRSLRRERARANLSSIQGLEAHLRGGPTPPAQTAEHLTEVSRMWDAMGAQL